MKVKGSGKLTMTVREAAEVTGIGLNNTYALLKSGEMPSIRIGKKFYIPRSALIRWLENCGSIVLPPEDTASNVVEEAVAEGNYVS